MATQKLNVAIFISGRGSNMESIIKACDDPDFPAHVAVVISNNPDALGLKTARNKGIPTIAINHKDFDTRELYDASLIEALSAYDLDIICLAGFMRIFTPVFINKFENKIINTHPSLLPKHGGKGMYGLHVHRSVIDSGDKQSGVSVHYVIAACDEGDIILQKTVPVLADDTPETLAARVLEKEHEAYPEAIKMIASRTKSL